jgi:hypothetical protein
MFIKNKDCGVCDTIITLKIERFVQCGNCNSNDIIVSSDFETIKD